MKTIAAFTMKKEFEGIMKRNRGEERTTGVVGGWGSKKETWEGEERGGGWRERGGEGVGGQEGGIAGSLPHLSGDAATAGSVESVVLGGESDVLGGDEAVKEVEAMTWNEVVCWLNSLDIAQRPLDIVAEEKVRQHC